MNIVRLNSKHYNILHVDLSRIIAHDLRIKIGHNNCWRSLAYTHFLQLTHVEALIVVYYTTQSQNGATFSQ